MWSGQPHPDEGHPPPLETVPVSWKGCRESPGGPAESPAGEEAQGEDSPTAAQLDVLRLRSSSMEIREKGSEFLKEELHKAQKELQLKDEECERLSKVREQLEQELEELTASLFEEAHRMVREANMKQAASEKQLKEARGKIDMLQAEVTALKTLVLTSTPASPNRELHPQLLSPTKAGPRKGHLRHKSTSSALCPAMCPTAGHPLTPDKEGKEVDTTLFAEFQAWRESPTLDKTCPFLERVYREDVGPCLDFTMQELSALVRAAVEDNTLTIEPVASQTLPAVRWLQSSVAAPSELGVLPPFLPATPSLVLCQLGTEPQACLLGSWCGSCRGCGWGLSLRPASWGLVWVLQGVWLGLTSGLPPGVLILQGVWLRTELPGVGPPWVRGRTGLAGEDCRGMQGGEASLAEIPASSHRSSGLPGSPGTGASLFLAGLTGISLPQWVLGTD
uniref:GDP/GTP exchange factor Sec2 N-terminal domain-containing protein n=1 Tax=Canis lupus familiaris TaxID=9615 RepID=A0A8C0TDW2_CANLF